MLKRFGIRSLSLSLLACSAFAQRAPLFKDEILPILNKSCNKCHNDNQKMAGLDLSTFSGVMAGGTNGPVIAPGKPERSPLWKMIESDRMPMGGKLSNADKQAIKAYIEQGRFPKEQMDAAEAAREAARITPEARQWWSFQRPVKKAVAGVPADAALRTHIDAFVEAKLKEKTWRLSPEADKVTLLRRAYFDLTGLPPTPAEVTAFLNDRAPDAYEKVLDRLLASPRYGEHWGRHWLDVAGYSDSRGDAGDSDREVSWKYRDYVIQAFNKNKPVDRFLLEQLAGDQLVNWDPKTRPTAEQVEAITATGFLRTTADITDNQTIYEVDKYFDALQKSLETSMNSVLGLTVGCARCHDHKFDPILQKDYYRLTAIYQAVFDPENWLAANLKYGPWPSRTVLDMDPQDREAWIKDVTSTGYKAVRRMEDLLEATYQRYRAELKAGRDMAEARRLQIRKDIESDPDLDVDYKVAKDFISDTEMEKRYPELLAWKNEIAEKRKMRKGESSVKPNMIEAAWDVSKTPSPTYVLLRGNYLAPGAEVKPGIPMVLEDPARPLAFDDPKQHPEWNHTGRRLTLARWLVSPEHPLTARVFVNRVWQFHFGEGIVRSVDDFGTQGSKPTHPELLDYLAVSFQEHGWDLKWLTKEIMLSRTYRQSSAEIAERMSADPANKLLWRKAPLRLEAETIRDSMLKVSGLLHGQMYGPPEAIKRGPDGQWVEEDKKSNPNRRSMYLQQGRTRPVTFLHAFDMPEMTSDKQSQRFRSALPIQSLAMLNSPLVMRTTKAFAQQLLERTGGDIDKAVSLAFEEAYSRAPRPAELAIAKQAIAGEPDAKEGLRLFLQAMLGANDFLYSY